MQKQIEKILSTSRVMLKKLILIRHLGSTQHFWLFCQNMSWDHVAGQNINSLQKTECKNIAKSQSYAPLIFSRHLESDKKLLFYEICLIKIQS
jgi:hypothetical protein